MSYTLSEDEKTHYLEDESRDAMLHLIEFSAKLSIKQPHLIVRQDKTSPATEILAAAEELSSDVIVVGTRGARGFTRLILEAWPRKFCAGPAVMYWRGRPEAMDESRWPGYLPVQYLWFRESLNNQS